MCGVGGGGVKQMCKVGGNKTKKLVWVMGESCLRRRSIDTGKWHHHM